ncbi:fructosamine kinase family protein [Nakamurella endophytica]|uniref:fructosamine kinase family protein n=1 Tax=Nakamurella endophytica TaxID=1748367 RepID=UPI00166DE3E9|nr:fructosamine kinase family protein [Nakamurella endophytica]
MGERDDDWTKHRAGAPAGFFAAEAAGLRWLGEARARGGAAVARVFWFDDENIRLERVRTAAPSTAAAAGLGTALAATHATGAAAFGVGPDDGPGVAFIGRQSLPLGRYPAWGAFYGELRLAPYARAAVDVGHLSADGARLVDRVVERLGTGEWDDGRPPARIHGDLWGGNVLYTGDSAVLIDPAAHGGHGETDLAMLALFGLPGLSRVQAAYAEAAGLDAGWRSRVGLHQLHPLLVHAVSHGPEYGREAERIARRYA